MFDGYESNMFSKVSSFIKSHIFDDLAVNHMTYYSVYKRDNLIFYRKYKNIANLSWAQFLWQYNNVSKDIVLGLCLLFIDLRNVIYKDTCTIENRYEKEIYVLIQSLSKKASQQNNNLVQKCILIEGLFFC